MEAQDYPNHRLLGTSFLSLATAILAVQLHSRSTRSHRSLLRRASSPATFNLYGCGALVFLVFVTSIAYWSHPVQGLRRNVDIAAVVACALYQVAVSFKSSTQAAYLCILSAGVACYAMSRRSSDLEAASWFHVSMHVLGNMSNVILYAGLPR